MEKYQIDKNKKAKKITKKDWMVEGIHLNPKIKERERLIKVEEITVVNKNLKEKVLKMQFSVAFKRLLKQVMNVSESENPSDGDIKLALSEVERMKQILKEKYKKELSHQEYHTMWRKAEILEEDLKRKIIYQEQRKEFLNQIYREEERGRSR